MENRLQTLLEELYRLDPSLRSHEKTLEPLLQELLTSKPDIQIDPQFQQHLHTLIQERTAESHGDAAVHSSFFNLFTMKKFSYAFAGATLATVLIVPLAYNFLPTPSFQFPQGSTITPIEEQGFGTLTTTSSDMRGLGGGGGGETSDTMSLAVSDELVVDDYQYVSVNYVYGGDPLALDAGTVDVIKRTTTEDLAHAFGDLFQSMDLELIDLSRFEDMKITYLSLVPSDNDGYSVNLDLVSDAVSLYRWTVGGWETEWTELTEADMLSDAELIALANDFVAQYDLPMEGYGEPEVVPYDTSWGVPEYVTVLYPLTLNDQSVYETWGGETGLNVNISLRDKRVQDMYGLQTQQYQSSAYSAVTDSAKVLKVAGRGGIYGFTYEEPDQTIDVTLGTPTQGYFHTTTYDAATASSQELFVPALIFPVIDKPTSVEGVEYMPYIQDYVVVPLAAEILETAEEMIVTF